MPGNLGVALLRCPGRPSHGRPMAWPMAGGPDFHLMGWALFDGTV